MNMSADDLVLEILVQFAKIPTPSPDTHDKIFVPFGMRLGISQGLHVERVDLKLLATNGSKKANQQGYLMNGFWISENRVGQFQRYRAAVADAEIVDLGVTLQQAEWTAHSRAR